MASARTAKAAEFISQSSTRGLVKVLRQPVLVKQPPHPPSKPPVSLILDQATLRLETAPDLSVQRGLWDVVVQADAQRSGRLRTTLVAKSLLHAGDGLTLALKVGRRDRFPAARRAATESGGGALAGALGLPADQSLNIQATGDGTSAAGRAEMYAISGQTTPLEGVAVWGKTGATVKGRVSLTASRLTKFLADRLGPGRGGGLDR